MEACIVTAKQSAATIPHNHCAADSGPRRKELARLFCHARGGPPPAVHQIKSARKIASAMAANGAPRLTRSNG